MRLDAEWEGWEENLIWAEAETCRQLEEASVRGAKAAFGRSAMDRVSPQISREQQLKELFNV